MLVIPVEKTVDWRKPPIATLALVLCNVLLFLVFLYQDDSLYTQARQHYVDAGLPALEIPAYEAYLERKIRLHGGAETELLLEIKNSRESHDTDGIIDYVITDLDFVAYLEKDGLYFWHENVYSAWRLSRTELYERYLSRLSDFAFGLLPAAVGLSDLVSYQFLHGDWGHLLGNMVFLFIIGFTVERALGATRFLMAYLLCGMLSGEFYSLLASDGWVPLIGASGAISGLMGMYVAIFGTQRIRFFYFFAIYIGYFSAPALSVLPVWLGKELVDYFFVRSSNIAFMAHVGGLLAGAALVALFRKSWLQVKEEFHDASDEEKDEAYRQEYDLGLKALGRMEFPIARERFRVLHKKYPSSFEVLLHLYHLEKLQPDQPAYASVLTEVADTAVQRGRLPLLMQIYREAYELGKQDFSMDRGVTTKVLYACIREGELKEAEFVFTHLKQRESVEFVREACQLLINAFKQREQQIKVNQYQDMLKTLE